MPTSTPEFNRIYAEGCIMDLTPISNTADVLRQIMDHEIEFNMNKGLEVENIKNCITFSIELTNFIEHNTYLQNVMNNYPGYTFYHIENTYNHANNVITTTLYYKEASKC